MKELCRANRWLVCMGLLLVLAIGANCSVDGVQESDPQSAPKRKPLEVNIVDIEGYPSLVVDTANRVFGIEFSNGEYKVTTKDVPILSFDEKLVDSKHLVYSVEDPVIFEGVKSVGYSVWKLVSADMEFKKMDQRKVTQCGTILMYGGHCSLSKEEFTYKVALPAHKQVRITATYHYLGGWIGNMAYLKIKKGGNVYYLWNEKHDNRIAPPGKSYPRPACESTHNTKFSQGIDVNVEHDEKELELHFGSTLDKHPCEASYGVSDIMVYYI